MLDTLESAEPGRRKGETGPAYQQVHLPAPPEPSTPPLIPRILVWFGLCLAVTPQPPQGRSPASAQDSRIFSGQLPLAPVHVCPIPHAQQRWSALPGRPRCRRVVSRCGCGPEAARGKGGTEPLVLSRGGARCSPAWWAAMGPSSSLGHRWAPGPAQSCLPPGAARSHSALQSGSFLTREVS